MNPLAVGSPQSQAATSGGLNGGDAASGTQDPRATLAAMVSQMDSPAAHEGEESTPAPEEGAPEPQVEPTAQAEPGENDLPAEEPPVDPENNGETGEEEPDLSHTDRGEAKVPLQRFNSVVSKLKDATEQLRILQEKVERLSEPEVGSVNAEPQPGLPEPIAKLKSVAEVEKRIEQSETYLDELDDFLRRNPDGTDQYPKDAVVNRLRELRRELRALPKRADQIRAHAQFEAQRKAVRAKTIADFPEFQDAEHPDAKLAHELIKAGAFNGSLQQEYDAMAYAIGHRALQTKLTQKAGARRTASPAAKPAGRIPTGKPHMASGGAQRKPSDGASVEGALKSVKENGSRSSLAGLLAATGR